MLREVLARRLRPCHRSQVFEGGAETSATALVLCCIALWSCKQADDGDGTETEPPNPLERYLETAPATEPQLSASPTGVTPTDEDTTIDRCKKTSFSYYQCTDVFPEQARTWLHWYCARKSDSSIQCTRLGTLLYRDGGERRALGKELLDRACARPNREQRHNCYVAAETLKDDDPKAALRYGERACDSEAKSPVGCKKLLPELRSAAPR